MLRVAFTSNLIGVACARSLHYQFYAWYFPSLPLLLWSCPSIPIPLRLCWLALMEWAWNVYPSTTASSLMIHALHLSLLYGLWRDWPLVQGTLDLSTRQRIHAQ